VGARKVLNASRRKTKEVMSSENITVQRRVKRGGYDCGGLGMDTGGQGNSLRYEQVQTRVLRDSGCGGRK